MTDTEFRLIVNGAQRGVTCEPDTPLLSVLRQDLGLAGPKFGCGTGLCGACVVLIDGSARTSCDVPVSAVNAPVTTVEGLSCDGRLHPVQQAFIDEQAAQCGYCTPGMVVAAAGLLRDHPAPTDRQVREALDGNLCRCGAYGRIVRAVLKAAGRKSAKQAVVPDASAGQITAACLRFGFPLDTTSPQRAVHAPRPASPSPLSVGPGARGAPSLPADLAANPVLARWLEFGQDGQVTIRIGKVEYGQGIWTALAQIAAEELQVALARVRVAPVSTSSSPDEGVTAGSLPVEDSGSALRQACAQARRLLLDAAARELEVPRAALDVADGQILTADGPTGLSYWTLAQPGMLDRPANVPVPSRPPGAWSVAGHSAVRLDFPDKVTGSHQFLHDVILPDMAYGRVVRPPARAAELTELDDPDLGGDTVLVRDGLFVGVVAETDRAARRAAMRAAQAARWRAT
jgi:nicotinate dehydrogenase subunit B